MSRTMIGDETLPEHIFQGVSFGPVSELGKFYIDFVLLDDGSPTVVSVFTAELSNF